MLELFLFALVGGLLTGLAAAARSAVLEAHWAEEVLHASG